ncbi:MAG TPA: serine--tRNA ligase [Candidatus Latescibacteria bacterium]|nr:serine--tRNA ligase [Candidatus Latescibacterota bacterium]
MIDLRLIREQTDFVKREIAKLFTDAPIDEILSLDEARRNLIREVEELKARRNAASKAISAVKDSAERQSRILEMREVGDRIAVLDEQVRAVEERLNARLLEVPNLPHPDVPVGRDESENVVTAMEGDLPTFTFEPRPHWEIGPDLGILDFERGVKISGSRFYVLVGDGARLQRALITWMLDLHRTRHGYVEVYPPAVVRHDCLIGTGQLPKFGENLYHDAEEDFWLVPTAEVPVTNLYAGEVLEKSQLPLYHVAYTPCFRREKMSAGKDVRGIKRGHEFDKVEMVKFVEPATSDAELTSLVEHARDVCRGLALPHRIVQMCTGDLSFTAAMKYDVEVWAAGCGEWLEVSSCSNFRDFQARRANIRYRPAPNARPEYVHTLNGSGLALPRVMIAIMENYQLEDGSIVIPEVLRPYLGGQDTISA